MRYRRHACEAPHCPRRDAKPIVLATRRFVCEGVLEEVGPFVCSVCGCVLHELPPSHNEAM